MCNIPIEVIEQARNSIDNFLYWAEESEDIPKNIYKEAEKTLDELEKYVPFRNPIEEAVLLSGGNPHA